MGDGRVHPERVDRLILVDAAGYPFQSQSVPLAFRIARTPVLNRLMRDVLPRASLQAACATSTATRPG